MSNPVLENLPPLQDGEEGEKKLEEEIVEWEERQKKPGRAEKKKEKEQKKEQEEKEKNERSDRLIERFYPREKGAGQMFVLVGKSERGKTHFLRWLLYSMCVMEKNAFQYGLIMVRTKFKHSYKFHWATQQHVRIYEGFRKDVLVQYVENLKQRYQEMGYLEPSFIVFDDLVGILNSADSWMQNFIGTYRHYNITLFIAVQYLTGKNAVTPIMREQTSYCIMFNSKVQRTLENLWLNYGQLMPRKDFYAHIANATDPAQLGTRHACVVYAEHEDSLAENYMSVLAPAKLPDGLVILKGPDQPKDEKTEQEKRRERRQQELGYRIPSWMYLAPGKHQDKLRKQLFFADAARQRLKSQTLLSKDMEVLMKVERDIRDTQKLAKDIYDEEERVAKRVKFAEDEPKYFFSGPGFSKIEKEESVKRELSFKVKKGSPAPEQGMDVRMKLESAMPHLSPPTRYSSPNTATPVRIHIPPRLETQHT